MCERARGPCLDARSGVNDECEREVVPVSIWFLSSPVSPIVDSVFVLLTLLSSPHLGPALAAHHMPRLPDSAEGPCRALPEAAAGPRPATDEQVWNKKGEFVLHEMSEQVWHEKEVEAFCRGKMALFAALSVNQLLLLSPLSKTRRQASAGDPLLC